MSLAEVKPRTRRYCSDSLIISKNEGIVSEASVSSCPSSSSDDSDSGTGPSRPFHRLKYTVPPKEENKAVNLGDLIYLTHKTTPDKTVIVYRKFLSASRIEKLVTLFRTDKSVFQIKDRKDDLYHAHQAYRVEVPLRTTYPKSYRKMMRMSIAICDSVWGDIREKKLRKNRVIPEIEYIEYDIPDGTGRGTFIEPHVDNHSIVTGVVMLSEPDVDYQGGINRFKGASTEGSADNFREYKLGKGDLVLFRGEEVTHWITPVTRGKRAVLQWELSRI